MKVSLIQIDKTSENYLNEGIEVYNKRLKNYTSYEITTINVPKAVRMRPETEQKREEATAEMQTGMPLRKAKLR